jgi:hypothetical protein
MSEQAAAFIDPTTGTTFTWRHAKAVARRRASNRVPLVGRTQLDDALQHAVDGLAVALGGPGSAYYVDSPSGLYKWFECVEFLRRRTLQRVARESRKAAHELEALVRVDSAGVRSAEGSLSSAGADPQNIEANRDMYNRVAS